MARGGLILLIAAALAGGWLRSQSVSTRRAAGGSMLAAFRNLGKAFYENPVTHAQAIEVFKKAFDLAPDSARERINYGLALLRGGKTKEGAAELEKAQRQDPSIPHTWFNLGIVYKKDGDNARAIAQFEQMVKLVPDEPSSHYNLGYLYKLTGKAEPAVKQFEEAERLDPNLGAPHFQLYNAYRQLGRAADSDRESKRSRNGRRGRPSPKISTGVSMPRFMNPSSPTPPWPLVNRRHNPNSARKSWRRESTRRRRE
jgi:Tfp pilus assembly protein PilF